MAATLVPFAVWRVPEALLIGVVTGIVAFGPAATGWIVRDHRDAAAAAGLRAEQTALPAMGVPHALEAMGEDRVQAVTAERARTARDLHDLVAGHLSAIALHSTAAPSIDEPGTSKEALTVIRENSRSGGDAAAHRHPAGGEWRVAGGGRREAGGGRRRPGAHRHPASATRRWSRRASRTSWC